MSVAAGRRPRSLKTRRKTALCLLVQSLDLRVWANSDSHVLIPTPSLVRRQRLAV
jgi:hypothetical protein